MTCTVGNQETADHSSQSITSSAEVKMSNWKAAEIQEMLASPRSLSLSSLSACCCSGKLLTVATFKLKAPC